MAKRGGAAQVITTKKPELRVPTAAEKRAAIDGIVSDATKKYGPGRIEKSENASSTYMLRRPTGITSLDLAMAGGWPAAAPSVLVGPEGAGKDYLLWRTMAESQKIYGEDFCAAVYFTEFRMDKLYMKDLCGFQIALSEDEIEQIDRARQRNGQPALTPELIDYYRHQVGQFYAIYGVSADHGFDELFKFLRSNVCQIVSVNSIGFMQTEAKEQTDSYEEFAQQRNEAMLLSKALPQFAMYANQPDEWGRPNETSVLLVNQVRSKDQQGRPMKGRPVQEKDTYKSAANAWALKHGKALEVFLHNGPKIYDEGTSPPLALGRKKQWEITKGKLGTHEGIKGEFDYFFNVGADLLGDLLSCCTKAGIVETSGSWLNYEADGFTLKAQGAARALEQLRKNPELAEHLRTRCFQETRTLLRTK